MIPNPSVARCSDGGPTSHGHRRRRRLCPGPSNGALEQLFGRIQQVRGRGCVKYSRTTAREPLAAPKLFAIIVLPILMHHSPIKRPAISKCSRCGRTRCTQHAVFKQNVSYFFGRKERQFSGDLCFSCVSRTFARVELTTLFGTWWGIIGFWLGPLYIVHNLVEYII